jgi:hypothetical protein
MREKIARIIEMITNICIIIVCILGVITLAGQFTSKGKNKTALQSNPADNLLYQLTSQKVPAVGNKISLSGIEFSKKNSTLILALSTTCKYCSQNAPFYQKLLKEARKKHELDVIAIFPQKDVEGRKYLKDMNVPVDKIVQTSLSDINIGITPTMILVDSEGVVSKVWPGSISQEIETAIIKSIGL